MCFLEQQMASASATLSMTLCEEIYYQMEITLRILGTFHDLKYIVGIPVALYCLKVYFGSFEVLK